MNTLPHADFFFFLSSILLTVLSAVFIVALVYVIKLVAEARSIAAAMKREVDLLAGDIGAIRERVRSEAKSSGKLLAFLSGIFAARKKGRKGRS